MSTITDGRSDPMNNQNMPLVSIVTPSFNQAAFIEETIQSVLIQDYPYIEHIVVDGGSVDGTLEILKKYSHLGNRFRYISEPDRGQSDAINKGLKMARGDIIGWLNSDDTYLSGAVSKAVAALQKHSEWAMVYGKAYHIDENSQIMNSYPVQSFDREDLFHFCIICQPAAFVRKNIFTAVGSIDNDLNFCMDYDLWIRISKDYPIGHIEDYLANSRLHSACKSVAQITKILPEIMKTSVKHFGTVANEWLYHFLQHYSQMGVFWYLSLFKKYDVLGTTPQILDMNGYSDLWVPPNFRVSIQVDPQYPLHLLMIKGINQISSDLSCDVSVNGREVQRYNIPSREFILKILVDSKISNNVIEIFSDRHIVPAELGINSDTRTLSFLIEELIPLSVEEYSFYQEFQKGPAYALAWMQKNRHPIPSL
ncbi:glycosyltransferase family 2 protein [Ectobacillus sp. sgz5001026]|uniref:glycosyltransferase family 2 protein n=1 Tax=Ectobacillus sp. sgz5001026 TaxID=3242473 RepID=UPI0036D3B46E